MCDPLISIIIPTYNRAHLIGETLESVLKQTYVNWECIIVDDGSNDNTAEVIEEYVKKDVRFQFHYRPTDRLKGGNAARNYGFEISKGEYINWFDSDDLMLTEFIKKKVDVIMNASANIDYVLCGFETFGIDYNVTIVYDLEYLANILDVFMIQNIIFSTPTFFFKRKIVNEIKFDESLTRAQDLDFVFRVLKCSNSQGINIKEVLVLVRNHNETITSRFKGSSDKDLISEFIVWKKIFKYLHYKSNRTSASYALRKYLKVARRALQNKKYRLFFKKINDLTELGFIFKIKISLLILMHFFSSRGIHYYKIMMNKEIKRLSKKKV